MECLFRVTVQYHLQTHRIGEAEDTESIRESHCTSAVVNLHMTYVGLELGAHTTAKDSGSILWKPEWVCRSTEDMKPKRSLI
jgi:hypothetical protein